MGAFKNIALVILMASVAKARTLTWSEAVALAQQNSSEYQMALSNYRAIEETERTGLSGFLPKVSASTGGTHGRTSSGNMYHSYSAQLSVSQNLFAGFADINTYYLRKSEMQKARAVLTAARSRLSAELKQSFAEVYYLQDYKKLTADILKRRRENYNNVKLQYEIGRENKGSLLLSESYVAMAEYDQMSTENSEEVAHVNLRRILGLPETEDIQILNNIPREEMAEKTYPDFAALADNHPEVLSARQDEMSYLYNQRISRAGFLPSLDFSGSYSYSDSRFFPQENDSWSVGLTLSIPLFSGFRTYSAYRAADARLEGSRYNTRNTLQKITADIKRAYFEYLQALQKEKIDQAFDKAAILRAEVARNKYKNGFITFEEWDIVETDLISRQKENLASERNRILKQSVWEQAQAIGVF